MKKFKVVLRLYLGEYEKAVQYYVEASDANHATYQAICDETHNTPPTFEEWMEEQEFWDGDVGLYRCDGCRQLNFMPRRLWDILTSYY